MQDFDVRKDERGMWWWVRTVNGQVVQASANGYRNQFDAMVGAVYERQRERWARDAVPLAS